jgi:biopolymer transport protein ExbD
MSEISTDKKAKSKKGKPKKMSTRIDFTPMVDLGFLLITFFMLTTTMIKPQTMELAMPSKDKVKPQEQNEVKASRAITIVLGKDNKIFYWIGMHDEKSNVDPVVTTTDFTSAGIRKFLLERNLSVVNKVEELKTEKEKENMPDSVFNRRKLDLMKDKSAPIILIKATDSATYKNLIDIFDEMAICSIGTYALVDLGPGDRDLLKNYIQ